MIRTSAKVLFIVFLTLCAVSISVVQAQPTPNSSIFWLNITDDAGGNGMAVFGNHQNATNGIDETPPTPIGEYGLPPDPPGFFVKFGAPPARPAAYGGQFINKDFRGFSSATQRDTFRIIFKNNDSVAQFTPGMRTIISWPSAAHISARCDSVVLIYTLIELDEEGNQVPKNTRINMTNQRSVELMDVYSPDPSHPNAGGSSEITIRILKWGAILQDTGTTPPSTSVRTESNLVPSGFALGQNYPNPFNPTTTLRFDIEAKSRAEIAIYNVLGQKVSTLFSGDIVPGTYSATWDGTNEHGVAVPSGVYFARMSAEVAGSADGHFSAVRKLVLMK